MLREYTRYLGTMIFLLLGIWMIEMSLSETGAFITLSSSILFLGFSVVYAADTIVKELRKERR